LKPDPNPILRVKTVSRIPIGSFKTKATINAKVGAELGQMSFYELLGITESGTLPEIKQAYKQLARKYHPDVSPPDRVEEYTRRFIRVQEAYETLSDPRMREIYDRDMAKGLHLAFSARRRYPHQNDEVLF
jgi:DnaJ-domain-containing protein 1